MTSYLSRLYDEFTKEKVKWAIIIGSIVILTVVVCYPVGILFWRSFHDKIGDLSFGNYVKVFTNPGLASSFKNSLIVAIGTTLGCLFIALPLAFGVARTNLPFKRLINALILVSFVIPSFIQAIAWILLAGPRAGVINVLIRDTLHIPITLNIFGLTGVIWVLTLNFYPFIYYSVIAALNNIDPAYEEAARMIGAKPWRTAVGITFPLVTPALASGSILTFLHGVAAFGAPITLALPAGTHVLTTRIYQLFTFPPSYELAAACATPIVVMTAMGLLVQKIFLGKKQYHTVTGKSGHPLPVDIGRWKYALLVFAGLVIFFAVVLPLWILLKTSIVKAWGLPLTLETFSLASYRHIFNPSFPALASMKNSLYLGLLVSTFCIALAIVIVWTIERGKIRGGGLLSFLCMITFAFPSTALGVGVLLAYMGAPFHLQGTLVIIALGFGCKKISYAYVLARNTMKQIHPEFEEAARVIGATWFQSIKDIAAPLLKSGIVVTWILVFASCLRELPIAILLYMTDNQTIAVSIFHFLDSGRLEHSATLSFILAIMSIATVFIVRKIAGKSVMEV